MIRLSSVFATFWYLLLKFYGFESPNQYSESNLEKYLKLTIDICVGNQVFTNFKYNLIYV